LASDPVQNKYTLGTASDPDQSSHADQASDPDQETSDPDKE